MGKEILIAIRITDEEYAAIEQKLRSRKLTAKQRRWLTVLRLRYKGLTNIQIAAQTGYSRSSVSQLLRKFKDLGLESYLGNKID